MHTILVIDDEPDLGLLIRQKFRLQIREGKLKFLSAYNGVEALAALEENPDVAVVLCDINMPLMDGLTLLERMSERFPLVRPVMISAYGDMSNIRSAMNRGAFDFLTKPLDLRDLEVTVDRALVHSLRLRDTLRALRENNILRMYVNEGVFRYLSQWKNEEQIGRAETIEGTVAFFDVCGFTGLSEQEPPEQVVELLNAYFDLIAKAVVERRGIVDKFIGDAVMAVFRESSHAGDGLAAALAARATVIDAARGFVMRTGRAPALAIGVHSGTMLSCSVGARSLARFDFTVIGDVVNTAARLQEQAGEWQIFASEPACKLAGDGFCFEDHGLLSIKGKTQQLRVYTVASARISGRPSP
jgi:adenylate cyclase